MTALTLRITTVVGTRTTTGHPSSLSEQGCQWWNLACQGSTQVVDAGMSAITRSTAAGAGAVLSQIVKVIDESTQVPLADPGYRHIYYGFLGLAAPLIAVILSVALILSALRRDPGTLGRAVVGVVVASLGGALYVGFAQLLVAIDNSLSHGIVRITGQDLTQAMTQISAGFERIAGVSGTVAANMMLIVLMMVTLLAGLILWFVLVLRKIAILVVVAFAPLLIAGYLWAPTRPWVRKATEVLVALVFTKSAIFGLFGIGLALLSRGKSQSLSDFVGTVVLLCGACFAPLVMLRLVHFAGNTQLAGDMMGTLRGGVEPVLHRLPHSIGMRAPGRHELARQQGHAPSPARATAPGASTGGVPPTSVASVGAAAAAVPAGAAAAGAATAAQSASVAVRAGAPKLAEAARTPTTQAPTTFESSDGPIVAGPSTQPPRTRQPSEESDK